MKSKWFNLDMSGFGILFAALSLDICTLVIYELNYFFFKFSTLFLFKTLSPFATVWFHFWMLFSIFANSTFIYYLASRIVVPLLSKSIDDILTPLSSPQHGRTLTRCIQQLAAFVLVTNGHQFLWRIPSSNVLLLSLLLSVSLFQFMNRFKILRSVASWGQLSLKSVNNPHVTIDLDRDFEIGSNRLRALIREFDSLQLRGQICKTENNGADIPNMDEQHRGELSLILFSMGGQGNNYLGKCVTRALLAHQNRPYETYTQFTPNYDATEVHTHLYLTELQALDSIHLINPIGNFKIHCPTSVEKPTLSPSGKAITLSTEMSFWIFSPGKNSHDVEDSISTPSFQTSNYIFLHTKSMPSIFASNYFSLSEKSHTLIFKSHTLSNIPTYFRKFNSFAKILSKVKMLVACKTFRLSCGFHSFWSGRKPP